MQINLNNMNNTPTDANPKVWLILINIVLLKYTLLSSDGKLELLDLKATTQMIVSWTKVRMENNAKEIQ